MRRGPRGIALGRVQARPDRRGAHVDRIQMFFRFTKKRDFALQRRRPRVELLSDGHRNRVLQLRAPHLHDVDVGSPFFRNDAARFSSSAVSLSFRSRSATLIAVGYESLVDCDMFRWSCGSTIL